MRSFKIGMSKSHTLFTQLSSHFSCNKARLTMLSFLIIGIIRARDVNLIRLQSFIESDATDQSQYRRLQRFFKLWKFNWKEHALFTLSKVKKPKKGYRLNMDRTNWKFGKTHINILTLGIVIGKVSMPLVWKTLPQATKRGNSNEKQRVALMNRVLQVLSSDDIYCLTLDREFNGNQWLEWLDEKGIFYVLRLRKNTLINGLKASDYKATRKQKTHSKAEVFGLNLYFGVKAIKKGRTDYLYVISNRFTPLEALEEYRHRWSIEVFFGHLKKKGFNLENTHMSQKVKMDKLIAVLSLSFLFTMGFGLLLREKKTLNAHDKRKSVFRLALDTLESMLCKPKKYKDSERIFDQWIRADIEPSNFVA